MLRIAGMQTAPVVTPENSDKRFRDEGWQELFTFDFIKQSYLITARHVHETVSSIEGLDEQTASRARPGAT